MQNKDKMNLGIMYRREHNPENLPEFARKAESAGFDELWVVEDCFYTSGIASAATALACTTKIRVGLGIMPSVVRNPVFTAMEIATLAGIYPGRFLPGIGHGVAVWMRQIGAFPKSQLAALEEVAFTVREMLAGKQVNFDGKQIHLEQAELVFPPERVPPISLGVTGPKSLSISGKAADGTILPEFSSPAFVAWAKGIIEEARTDSDLKPQRLTVFAFACAGATKGEALEQIRPMMTEVISSGNIDGQLAPTGFLDSVKQWRESKDPGMKTQGIHEVWIEQLAVVGTPQDWSEAINNFAAVGVDSLILVPLPDKSVEELDVFAGHIDN
ncbi:MAG: LLM class flavin-dependent oxidoreductase [Anaerolineaceae bacterium]|nr:LLM class flavin-dependent oxidoreductase [Anaerolineaceae bacterium]